MVEAFGQVGIKFGKEEKKNREYSFFLLWLNTSRIELIFHFISVAIDFFKILSSTHFLSFKFSPFIHS